MYIKFKADDVEVELGGFDHKALIETFNAVFDILHSGKEKKFPNEVAYKPQPLFYRDYPKWRKEQNAS